MHKNRKFSSRFYAVLRLSEYGEYSSFLRLALQKIVSLSLHPLIYG